MGWDDQGVGALRQLGQMEMREAGLVTPADTQGEMWCVCVGGGGGGGI